MNNYRAMEKALATDVSPAELNGFAWALVIGGQGDVDIQMLMRSLLGVDSGKVCAAFERQLEEGRKQLATDEVELLLPPEDAPIAKRLDALSQWCQSFLSLLGHSAAWQDQSFVDRINPLLEDYVAFSNLDVASHADYKNLEEFERDFMEIYEYLRAGIVYLNLEFANYRNE